MPYPRRVLGKLGMEFGPLLAFFIANASSDIFWATGVFMAATALATGWGWWQARRLPVVPTLSLVILLVLGAATLLTEDPIWVLVRPTPINGGFALLLLGSVLAGRPGLRLVLGDTLHLDPRGWSGLSLRVVLFLGRWPCRTRLSGGFSG